MAKKTAPSFLPSLILDERTFPADAKNSVSCSVVASLGSPETKTMNLFCGCCAGFKWILRPVPGSSVALNFSKAVCADDTSLNLTIALPRGSPSSLLKILTYSMFPTEAKVSLTPCAFIV